MTERVVGRPSYIPAAAFADGDHSLHVSGNWIWAPLKAEWRVNTPEETVRQQFIHRLHAQYGFSLAQMDQERRTAHGRKAPRADIVVCKDTEALSDNRDYAIVVECKSDSVTIDPDDYDQGESYARAVGCEFLVTHNNKETRAFRLIPGAPGHRIDIEDIPSAMDLGDAKRLEAIRRATKAFTREEFRRLLFDCHCILRDNHKLDPGKAFDEISKVLFIKMWVERTGDHEKFTEEYLRQYAHFRRKNIDQIMQDLFADTKAYYKADDLFSESDKLEISFETFRRIVKKLERFNLSATSDDVKGIAFERFLGETFRGELGQFFTPRPIVDFMVEMIDPREGEIVCDPASGSGGFLIKCFEYLRARIEADIHSQKQKVREQIALEAVQMGWDEEEEARRLNEAFAELNRQLDVQNGGARLHATAHNCVFGIDAEARAARTSKMNMIMHGDGHGGIHHHDGLVDVNGIFPSRFDIVLTNPPFGATVGKDQRVGDTLETRPTSDTEKVADYVREFGNAYLLAHERVVSAMRRRDPILQLYDIGVDPIGGGSGAKVRASRLTEMLFLERCISLLKPGGRMGIVLPDGILNNPSHQWLRDYCEGRAKILAVISIPQDVFAGANATVKTSLVFLRRFTDRERDEWEDVWRLARNELCEEFAGRRAALEEEYGARIARYDRDDIKERMELLDSLKSDGGELQAAEVRREIREMVSAVDRRRREVLKRELAMKQRAVNDEEAIALRARVKQLFDYPIFMAEVEKAGVTATGDTGQHVPNELPDIVKAFREYLACPSELGTAMRTSQAGKRMP